jgi:peptidoglycan/xylan/chitin deacetylase (PgdA/CDA1 family)/prolyl-tRNA editing enzyme YbaK/EbsC (Cys-tRNA(Pro) deacylase)
VQERLRERGLDVEVRDLPDSTRTAADAAAAVGSELGQIVKSLVFVADGEPVMCLCAGDRRVDPAKLGSEARAARADEAREATGFAIGGVPPLGHDRPLRTVVDESLRRFDRCGARPGRRTPSSRRDSPTCSGRCPTRRCGTSRPRAPCALGALAVTLVLALPAGAAVRPPAGDGPSVVQQLVWQGAPIYCGGSAKRLVALTFDDGPGPWTLALAATLRRSHAPATFFQVGSRIKTWPAGARAAAGAGELGNHTWSHPHLPRLRPRAIRRQLQWTQVTIVETTRRVPAVFRPPYEQGGRRVDAIGRGLGLLDVRWTIDSGDSRRGATASSVVREVLSHVRPGAIVLLHDSHAWTPVAARAIVTGLRARHLRPVTVTTLLERDPPARRDHCGA